MPVLPFFWNQLEASLLDQEWIRVHTTLFDRRPLTERQKSVSCGCKLLEKYRGANPKRTAPRQGNVEEKECVAHLGSVTCERTPGGEPWMGKGLVSIAHSKTITQEFSF